jgi:internalin A
MANPAVHKKALEMIERARREQSKRLNLNYMLSGESGEIPSEIFELHQLEEISLDGNYLRVIPERIRELPNLKRLSVVRNPIEKLPNIPGLNLDWTAYLQCRDTLSKQNVEGILITIDKNKPLESQFAAEPYLLQELALLPRLTILNIDTPVLDLNVAGPKPTGELLNLINNLDQLHQLQELDFFSVHLEKVPDSIRGLKGLKGLAMFGAGLKDIPDWLGELVQLKSLQLSLNALTILPESLANLIELENIGLGHTDFKAIPDVLFRMKSLKYINLGRWKNAGYIKQIPADILQLPVLERLDVDEQPIEIPPAEIVNQGVEAIKNYWRQQQETGIDYLCEAKLIILGEAGAGKTSLAKKIKNQDYQLQPDEISTEGIDVIRWSFPAAVRVKRDGREELHNTSFKVSIWDFGGQEIYHATHQFFLTRRSLYALVTDDRKEDTDFNYWMQVVELLSDRSPMLIVQNEKQDRQRDIDIASLRANFPNLQETFRTNLATNRGLDELKRAIQQKLEQLPHIGTPLPKTWSQVRTALENDARNHISLDEYFIICKGNGFTRREDSLQLSGYLHDLGICLHFQDDPVLKNTVILKPKWGTDAVYRVLDDKTVLDRRGRFSPDDLERIWFEEKYADMRHELLRLMMKFQLCYQLPGMEAYIAPQLLSSTRPDHAREIRGGLVLRYDYDFMPKGIITRFIVAMNHLIPQNNPVWKSGVILERDGSWAEVTEDYARRKITVRVAGADTRGLLAIVDDQLERIHESFARLKYDKYLPCNCEVCQKGEEPFLYPLSELKDFATQGDKIQCRVSRKLVDALYLIKDVLPSASYVGLKIFETPRQEGQLRPEASPVKEVFVSYAWTDESIAIVDKLQETLKERDIILRRDKNDIRYKDSIRDFMQRIGRGKCIVVILSKEYLESKSCMFELTEIAERGEIRDRVFPIVLDDATIYEGLGRLGYIEYWEQKKEALNAAMNKVGGEFLQGIREELDLYAKIRNTIAQIVDILGDMNALSQTQHLGSGFGTLIQTLETRISE